MLLLALAVAACGFAFMGLVAMWAPARVTGQFGISVLDMDGRNEVRAVYGGFGLAVAVALVATLFVPAWRAPAAVAVVVSLGGMAFGRVFSAVVDRHIGRFPMLYGTIEGVSALVLFLAATH
jgi:Domain of unknown function (DUF4345)